jgi:hypothetical protein
MMREKTRLPQVLSKERLVEFGVHGGLCIW